MKSTSNILFKGILPALPTPLFENGTVNLKAVAPMIDRMSDAGVAGFYILGGTGEGGVLSEIERMRMAEAAADAIRARGKQMILHIGAADTQSALRLARQAGELGADAVSSVYPNFFCSYKPHEAADYYAALVQASSLPMLGYCSQMIGAQSPYSVVERLMQVDGVIGVKYTFPNYYHLGQIKQLNGGNINVINGPDETLLCGLCMGADGGIGATYGIVPAEYVKLYNCVQANDLKGASEIQARINRLIDCLLCHELIPAIKCVMDYQGDNVGPAAFPGKRYSAEEKAALIREIQATGVEL